MSGLHDASFPPFIETDPTATGIRWEKWLVRLNNFFVVKDITSNKVKRAALLHYAGEWVLDVFLSLPDRGDDNDYDTAIKVLNTHFIKKKNVDYEIFKFREAIQQPDETFNQYYSRLRQLSQTCGFNSADSEIKSQIISKGYNNKLRKSALQTANLTLTKLLEIGNILETSEHQASQIEAQIKSQPETVNKSFRSRNQVRNKTSKSKSFKPQANSQITTCYFCNRPYPHSKGRKSCPAYGKTCRNCGKQNHFSKCCLSKQTDSNKHFRKATEELGDSDSETDEKIFYVCHTRKDKNPIADLQVNEIRNSYLVDSEATANIIDEASYQKLILDLQEIEKLENIAVRSSIQELLLARKAKLKQEIKLLKKKSESNPRATTKLKISTVKITSYTWNQTDKCVKIYLPNLNGIHQLDRSNVNLTSEGPQQSLTINSMNEKNLVFVIPKLLHAVKNTSFKVKTDVVLLTFQKVEKEKWEYLTEKEKASKPDKDADPWPPDGMMKKVYEDGDDVREL